MKSQLGRRQEVSWWVPLTLAIGILIPYFIGAYHFDETQTLIKGIVAWFEHWAGLLF